MPLEAVRNRLDSSRNPHVVQKYDVPGKTQWKDNDTSIHESAIYSMWMHLTEYVHFTQNGWSPTKGKYFASCTRWSNLSSLSIYTFLPWCRFRHLQLFS